MTQKARALELLQRGPLCSFAFFTDPLLGSRLGARICELRDEGHRIVTQPCKSHRHDSAAVEYVLIAQPVQQSLIVL